ncbi:PH domain-containing protein [Halobacteriovorax sp. DPLXC-1]|uniref:PH domain-containing protein n=1 Tax=Halobacteriovorax sp. DPLXC-1 TaxID=3110771 RepID=UPI002FF18B2D
MRYRSKLDPIVSIVLLLPIANAIFRLVSFHLASSIIDQGSLIFIFIYGIVLSLIYFGIFYEIKDDELVVSNLFIKTRMPIASIKLIKKSKNFLAAPALSLDRIKIVSDEKWVLISPVKKEELIKQLKRINPLIDLQL